MAASIMCELMDSIHTLCFQLGSFPIGNVEENVKVWHRHKGNQQSLVSSFSAHLMASICVLTVATFRQQNYLAKFLGQTHSITSAYQYDDRNCNSTDTHDKREANFSHRESKINAFLAPTSFCVSLSSARHR